MYSVTILTTDASSRIAWLHDRMPAILCSPKQVGGQGWWLWWAAVWWWVGAAAACLQLPQPSRHPRSSNLTAASLGRHAVMMPPAIPACCTHRCLPGWETMAPAPPWTRMLQQPTQRRCCTRCAMAASCCHATGCTHDGRHVLLLGACATGGVLLLLLLPCRWPPPTPRRTCCGTQSPQPCPTPGVVSWLSCRQQLHTPCRVVGRLACRQATATATGCA